MPSEINQTEMDKYCMISLICRIIKKIKANFIEVENGMVVTRSWGEEEMGICSQRIHTFSYKKNKI